MNTNEALKANMEMSMFVLSSYIGDLSDAEMLERPGPGCNHIAWQLGHLISSEASMLNAAFPGKAAALPEGFAENHSKATAESNDKSKFCTRQQYLDLFNKVRESTMQVMNATSDAQMDAPAPEHMRSYCPTVGHLFNLIGMHPMMHAGQFVTVRRRLGKPIVI